MIVKLNGKVPVDECTCELCAAICQWLEELTPVGFVFPNIMTEARGDCLIVFLGCAISLLAVVGSSLASYTEDVAQGLP